VPRRECRVIGRLTPEGGNEIRALGLGSIRLCMTLRRMLELTRTLQVGLRSFGCSFRNLGQSRCRSGIQSKSARCRHSSTGSNAGTVGHEQGVGMAVGMRGLCGSGGRVEAVFVPLISIDLDFAGRKRMGGIWRQLFGPDIFPAALCVFLGAADARSEVLDAIHVQSSAPVAGWHHSVASLNRLHAGNHLCFERAVGVFGGSCGAWRRMKRRLGVGNEEGACWPKA